MSILCLTGWQQPADSLKIIAPDATHFDYASYDNTKDMFAALPKNPRIAIGWSLGGQLLVRAIAGGYVKPDFLMLLGAPFQWVKSPHFTHGVGTEIAEEVQTNYGLNAADMIAGFHTLVAHGDTHEKRIIRTLNEDMAVWKNGAFWLNELATASCAELNFRTFPPTVVVHGQLDKVITPYSAEAYRECLPESEVLLLPACAHAPHLHDPGALHHIVHKHV